MDCAGHAVLGSSSVSMITTEWCQQLLAWTGLEAIAVPELKQHLCKVSAAIAGVDAAVTAWLSCI